MPLFIKKKDLYLSIYLFIYLLVFCAEMACGF